MYFLHLLCYTFEFRNDMRHLALFTTLCFSFFTWNACQLKDSSDAAFKEIALAQDIYGAASPIRLQADSTLVLLRDYFHENLPDSIYAEGLQVIFEKDKTVLIGQIQRAVGVLKAYVHGREYAIPLYQNQQKKHSIRVYLPENSYTSIALKGTFTQWNPDLISFDIQGDTAVAEVWLDPGMHQYVLIKDGKEIPDPSNPDQVSNGMGGYNSVLRNENSKAEDCQVIETLKYEKNILYLSPLGKNQELIVLLNNSILPKDNIKNTPDAVELHIPLASVDFPRSRLRVFSFCGSYRLPELEVIIKEGKPVQFPEELDRHDWHASTWYFMMMDRFKNGNPNNDRKVNDLEILDIANYFGGDIAGVEEIIAKGYFDLLGINTLWLSPITQNPEGAWGLWDKGGVRTKFSGYHGYWPVSNVRVDDRFGSAEELRSMLQLGHQQNMNFLLDYVANHVHKEHPIYQKNPDWATELYLPDGSLNTERWDEHRLTTWFDTFMPTLDLRRPEIVEPMSDSALVWVRDFDFDGFRHDATKHIDELFWRTLTLKMKHLNRESLPFQIGETYGSPSLINSYISTGMLQSQFDFNLYDAAVQCFAQNGAHKKELLETLENSLHTYGAHHLMGNISGNQDRARFISYAHGDVRFDEDAKLAGYTREIKSPENQDAYKKLLLLHAFNISIPGVPIIYYGDEIGMPGANDPDNRRMMRFDSLSTWELFTLENTQKLFQFRKNQLPLSQGSTEIIKDAPEELIVIKRSYLDKIIYCVINPSDKELVYPWKNPKNTEIVTTFSSEVPTDQWKLKPYAFDFVILQRITQ